MKVRHSSWLSKIGVEAHKVKIDLRESLSLYNIHYGEGNELCKVRNIIWNY